MLFQQTTRFGFEFTPFMNIGTTIFQWMSDLDPPTLPGFIDHAGAKALPPCQELGMPASEITIAEVLKSRGYYTAHIGKWHLGYLKGMRPEDQGFDDSLNMAGIVFGGREKLEEMPVMISLLNCNSPMHWDSGMLDSMQVYVKANQPVLLTPFLIMGAMSPVSIPAARASSGE